MMFAPNIVEPAPCAPGTSGADNGPPAAAAAAAEAIKASNRFDCSFGVPAGEEANEAGPADMDTDMNVAVEREKDRRGIWGEGLHVTLTLALPDPPADEEIRPPLGACCCGERFA